MITNRFLKTLALPVAAALGMFAASCSNDDNILDEQQPSAAKYEIPVTVSATRSGDDASTRAVYDSGTRKLTFEEGDQLFIQGTDATAGTFAGLLSNTAGAPGTFSGTLTTTNEYTGTFEALFTSATTLTATLLPKDYSTNGNGYLTLSGEGASQTLTVDATKAFVTAASADAAKKLAIEQLSLEQATAYSSGFALTPVNAVLNYTLSGLTASTSINVTVSDGSTTVSGSATADGNGTASFAVGIVPSGTTTSYMMTKGGEQTIEFRANLSANKVYNITRSAAVSSDCLSGVFSVASGKTVKFSKGNLQAVFAEAGSSWTWRFATNQYDYIGGKSTSGNETQTGNNFISGDGTVDLFGWSTSATLYGINSSKNSNDYSGDFLDWGAAASKNLGYGWRTLTSTEWTYLLNGRTSVTNRYCKAKVNSVPGMVIFPDSYSHPSGPATITSANTTGVDFTTNTWSGDNWTAMETAGAVFLPAAGYRVGTDVSSVGVSGYYWSSTAGNANASYAYNLNFGGGFVNPAESLGRCNGRSVRLVQNLN